MAYVILFQEMWRYGQGLRWRIVVFLVAHGLSHLGTLSIPLIFAQILNTLQTVDQGAVLSRVAGWIAVWIGASLWFNVLHRTGRYYELHVAYRIRQAFLNRHYGVLTGLPMKWHADHHSGHTIDRVNLAATALSDYTGQQFIYITLIMGFWGPLFALAFLSWHLSVIAFVMGLIAIAIIVYFDQRLIVLYRTINGINHSIAATFFDYVSNIRTIITLRLGRRTAREFDHQLERGYGPFMEAEARVNAIKWFLVSITNTLTQAIAVFYYIWRQLASGQSVLIGNAAAVLQYGQQLTNSFGNIAREYQTVVQRRINYESARGILDVAGGRDALALAPDRPWAQVAIQGLDFAYEPGRPVLSDVALSFDRGERIALVGESGSGKSTLLALLRGLHAPDRVSLSVDGDMGVDLAPLFALTTLMPQEPEIFENTVGFNIRFGIDYPETDVLEAVRLACFDGVLARLPQGLESDVRERGVSLSGGERQRLALARGILAARNSSLVLLDEPTSNVDASNELAIYENLFAHFAGRTVVSSIHRLHLLARFDRVIVMAGGRVVDSGSFEALKARDGPFLEIWQRYLEASAPTE